MAWRGKGTYEQKLCHQGQKLKNLHVY